MSKDAQNPRTEILITEFGKMIVPKWPTVETKGGVAMAEEANPRHKGGRKQRKRSHGPAVRVSGDVSGDDVHARLMTSHEST